MGRPKLFTEPLVGGQIFHVYNQTNNKEDMFKNDWDRWKFLNNLKLFIAPFAHIFAYNLMRNHFHLLIEVFDKEQFLKSCPKQYIEFLPDGCRALVLEDTDNMEKILSNRFASLFKGYAGSFNYWKNRSGNFFHRPFCRKKIHSEDYFKQATYYIHANSIRHNITKKILDYEWTSFHFVAANNSSLLSLNRMYDYFGGHEAFIKFHKRKHQFNNEEAFSIEEEDVFRIINKKEEAKKKKVVLS